MSFSNSFFTSTFHMLSNYTRRPLVSSPVFILHNGPNETLLAFGLLKQKCHKGIIFSLKKIYKRNHMEKLLKHLQNSKNIYTQQCFIKCPKGTEIENWPRYDCDLGT